MNPRSNGRQFDDLKAGYDNNGDGDILDAGDDVQVADNFSSAAMSLSYDANGNLTDDGVLRLVYDAWNRLRQVQRYADGDTTTIGTYSFLADNRRASKVVTNCGVEATPNDGGNSTVHYYYGGMPNVAAGLSAGRWSIFEERNGSDQSLRQYVWGTQYVDEPVFLDVNGAPSNSNDCDPDNTPQGETGQDRRYFYHQDRNWNVGALTEYADGAGTNGRIAERYHYAPYGEFVVLNGNTGSGELGNALPTSLAGNVFTHQGLPFDRDKGSHQNRHREYAATLQRFAQGDPARRASEPYSYLYVRSNPTKMHDPTGLRDEHAEPCEKRCCACETMAHHWCTTEYDVEPDIDTFEMPCEHGMVTTCTVYEY